MREKKKKVLGEENVFVGTCAASRVVIFFCSIDTNIIRKMRLRNFGTIPRKSIGLLFAQARQLRCSYATTSGASENHETLGVLLTFAGFFTKYDPLLPW